MGFPGASSFGTGGLKNKMLQTERDFVVKTYVSMLETCANVERNCVWQLKKFLEQWNERRLFIFFMVCFADKWIFSCLITEVSAFH